MDKQAEEAAIVDIVDMLFYLLVASSGDKEQIGKDIL